MVSLVVPISSHSWSAQQQLSSSGRYSGFELRLLKKRAQARGLGLRKRGVVLVSAAKSKKWQWDVWEQKEVTLDDADLILLEMRRKLGESKDESLAKVIAKKVIPYATNLEVDKIVKQKGVKPFLELLKVEEVEKPKVSTARRNNVNSPKASRLEVEGLQPPPRRPGDARPAPPRTEYEWPDEADEVLQRFQRPPASETRRFTDDLIQLSPKPRGEAESKAISYSPVASPDAGIPGFRGEKTRSLLTKAPPPPKPSPELNSRPARRGDAEVLPAPGSVVKPPRDMPVPNLNLKPEVRRPVAEPEEEPGVPLPNLSMKPEAPSKTPTPVPNPEEQPGVTTTRREAPVPNLRMKPDARPETPTRVVEAEEKGVSKREVPLPNLSMKPEARLETPAPVQQPEEQPGVATIKREVPVPSLTMKPEARPETPTRVAELEDQPGVSAAKRELPVPSLSMKPEPATPTAVAEDEEQRAAPSEVPIPSLSLKPESPSPTQTEADSSPELAVPEAMQKPVRSSDFASLQTGDLEANRREPDKVSGFRGDEAEAVLPVLSKPQRAPESSDDENSPTVNQSLAEEPTVKTIPVLNKPPAKDFDNGSSGDENGKLPTSRAVKKEVPLPTLASPPAGANDKETSSEPSTIQESSKIQRTQAPASQEEIDRDWALAEAALESKTIQEVLFIGSNAGGMIARFGCLNGFLPGRDLLETRGLKTLRSWAREKGYEINHTSVWDSSEGAESTFSASKMSSQGLDKDAETHSLHPACEVDINKLYREYRISLLSSLVGERANVTVTLVDRTMKKLVFSEKKAVLVNPDVVQKRSEFMAQLKVGDILKGRVRNISLFGVFVELLEDVTGLIHFSELSWTPVSDPAELISVGQELEVMVLKLDQDRQRINLSLKRMSPDPLLESVESMLAKEASPTESEAPAVPEFDELLKKLELREEIQSAVKGRCIDGAAFVPSFQVYLSSTLPEGYKLLARFENHVQEVLLKTSISRDALIAIIRESTSSEVVEERV